MGDGIKLVKLFSAEMMAEMRYAPINGHEVMEESVWSKFKSPSEFEMIWRCPVPDNPTRGYGSRPWYCGQWCWSPRYTSFGLLTHHHIHHLQKKGFSNMSYPLVIWHSHGSHGPFSSMIFPALKTCIDKGFSSSQCEITRWETTWPSWDVSKIFTPELCGFFPSRRPGCLRCRYQLSENNPK